MAVVSSQVVWSERRDVAQVPSARYPAIFLPLESGEYGVGRLGLAQLSAIDWPLLQKRDFSRDPDDPIKVERYQAEALVHSNLPVTALVGVICYSQARKTSIDQLATDTGTIAMRRRGRLVEEALGCRQIHATRRAGANRGHEIGDAP